MGIREQLTPEAWKAVYNAPFAAAVYVTASSGSYTEERLERRSANKVIKDTLKQGGGQYGDLVVAIVTDMNAMSGKDKKALTVQYKQWGLEMMRGEAWMIVDRAVKALKDRPGLDGFQQWVMDVARHAAETSRGGLLSMTGDTPLDNQEIFALTEIERIFAGD